ncbi:MAG: hypothetical protein IKD21_00520 [Clostridia bacterium]|nr:hypothetical protein [Clostridia bacterium]
MQKLISKTGSPKGNPSFSFLPSSLSLYYRKRLEKNR